MERPKQAAAVKARELIRGGWSVASVDASDLPGMGSDDEGEGDAVIPDVLSSESEEEEAQTVPRKRARISSDDARRFRSYGDRDERPKRLSFTPLHVPGPHVTEKITRSGVLAYTKAMDFFKLFITAEFIQMLCTNTNLYGWLHVDSKTTYARSVDGGWDDVSEDEMYRLLGLILLMGFINLPDLPRYWSTATLYHGGWARRFLSRNRFKALLGMLHVSEPGKDDPQDKVTKIRPFIEHMKRCCAAYYQPKRNLSIDERLVKSKGRSGIRQYMKSKPAKFGIKLWCACEAETGYTLDFDVYTGRHQKPHECGLGHGVVMQLLEQYKHQGYIVYCDNFFTSVKLVSDLLGDGVAMCGTTLPSRKGFPQEMKDKSWASKAKRGSMRYVRRGKVLCLQWKDNKPVCVLSSVHYGHHHVMVRRKQKDATGAFKPVYIKKPRAIQDYNRNMGGIDLSDQLIERYNVLMKCHRWWKTIFLHLLDIAVVNSYILFQQWGMAHPEVLGLHRHASYAQLHFREELVRQLGDIADGDEIPTVNTGVRQALPSEYHITHCPEHMGVRNNCLVCYLTLKKELKTVWKCCHPICNVHLCMNQDRNCFRTWHSAQFDLYRNTQA